MLKIEQRENRKENRKKEKKRKETKSTFCDPDTGTNWHHYCY